MGFLQYLGTVLLCLIVVAAQTSETIKLNEIESSSKSAGDSSISETDNEKAASVVSIAVKEIKPKEREDNLEALSSATTQKRQNPPSTLKFGQRSPKVEEEEKTEASHRGERYAPKPKVSHPQINPQLQNPGTAHIISRNAVTQERYQDASREKQKHVGSRNPAKRMGYAEVRNSAEPANLHSGSEDYDDDSHVVQRPRIHHMPQSQPRQGKAEDFDDSYDERDEECSKSKSRSISEEDDDSDDRYPRQSRFTHRIQSPDDHRLPQEYADDYSYRPDETRSVDSRDRSEEDYQPQPNDRERRQYDREQQYYSKDPREERRQGKDTPEHQDQQSYDHMSRESGESVSENKDADSFSKSRSVSKSYSEPKKKSQKIIVYGKPTSDEKGDMIYEPVTAYAADKQQPYEEHQTYQQVNGDVSQNQALSGNLGDNRQSPENPPRKALTQQDHYYAAHEHSGPRQYEHSPSPSQAHYSKNSGSDRYAPHHPDQRPVHEQHPLPQQHHTHPQQQHRTHPQQHHNTHSQQHHNTHPQQHHTHAQQQHHTHPHEQRQYHTNAHEQRHHHTHPHEQHHRHTHPHEHNQHQTNPQDPRQPHTHHQEPRQSHTHPYEPRQHYTHPYEPRQHYTHSYEPRQTHTPSYEPRQPRTHPHDQRQPHTSPRQASQHQHHHSRVQGAEQYAGHQIRSNPQNQRKDFRHEQQQQQQYRQPSIPVQRSRGNKKQSTTHTYQSYDSRYPTSAANSAAHGRNSQASSYKTDYVVNANNQHPSQVPGVQTRKNVEKSLSPRDSEGVYYPAQDSLVQQHISNKHGSPRLPKASDDQQDVSVSYSESSYKNGGQGEPRFAPERTMYFKQFPRNHEHFKQEPLFAKTPVSDYFDKPAFDKTIIPEKPRNLNLEYEFMQKEKNQYDKFPTFEYNTNQHSNLGFQNVPPIEHYQHPRDEYELPSKGQGESPHGILSFLQDIPEVSDKAKIIVAEPVPGNPGVLVADGKRAIMAGNMHGGKSAYSISDDSHYSEPLPQDIIKPLSESPVHHRHFGISQNIPGSFAALVNTDPKFLRSLPELMHSSRESSAVAPDAEAYYTTSQESSSKEVEGRKNPESKDYKVSPPSADLKDYGTGHGIIQDHGDGVRSVMYHIRSDQTDQRHSTLPEESRTAEEKHKQYKVSPKSENSEKLQYAKSATVIKTAKPDSQADKTEKKTGTSTK